ncbi:hypothetical protein BJ508DRAFT_418145 [Ascobolus immersus RN42]|uniref:Uncharacterized protein n=1 Tax=Ascobolus immersus RN42 TaxID=1160509 RepID=A0A3N4HNU3_ASCIM|nr:hypothetical protein BJ508DRAFT_418145 [Ascobolus immersus RN42]
MSSNNPSNNSPENTDSETTKYQHEGVDKPVKPYHTHVQHFINIPMADEDFDIDPVRMKELKRKWEKKLVGKKFVETEGEVATQAFNKQQLPELSRVLPPKAMVTKDYRPGRLNVYLNDANVCTHCTLG